MQRCSGGVGWRVGDEMGRFLLWNGGRLGADEGEESAGGLAHTSRSGEQQVQRQPLQLLAGWREERGLVRRLDWADARAFGALSRGGQG